MLPHPRSLVMAALAVALPNACAWADVASKMIRITCIPEISLFELETFGLSNISNVPKNFGASTVIYELGDFVAAAPFMCQLSSGMLQVDVVYHHPPAAQGMCGGVDWARLSLKLNGVEISQIRDTHGGCTSSEGHRIRATRYHLTHCRAEFVDAELTAGINDPQLVEMRCNTTAFPVR